MHKWYISPPEYIMVDLWWYTNINTRSPTSTQGQVYLIFYGIKGNHCDVPGDDVYDKGLIFESNKMVLETDLDMNGHHLLNTNLFATNLWQCFLPPIYSYIFTFGNWFHLIFHQVL